MSKVKLISIDTEFTYFDMMSGDMIALGLVEVLEDLTIGRKKAFFFKPHSEKYFTEKAREIHGISLWKAQTFPEVEVSCQAVLDWVDEAEISGPIDVALYGTWDFDKKWIYNTFNKGGMAYEYSKRFGSGQVINVMKMARKNLKHVDVGNFALPDVCKHYNIPLDHHQVLSDAEACAQIYINIENKIDTWTGELF